MGWLGKLVGGSIGFAIGGPLGAVLGTTFGHAFDSGSRLKSSYEYISMGERSQLTFFTAAFSMLAKLAQADGEVSREEINSIEKFITHDLKLNEYSSRAAISIFNTALRSSQTFDAFANQFYDQFYDQPQMLEVMIDIMLRVSIADGNISRAEEDLLLRSSDIFRFSRTKYNRIRSKYEHSNTSKYYSILGCKPEDADETLKRNYRKRVQEYHPDKISAKGLPEEFTKFANSKFREIQEAWEHIKKYRKLK